MKEILILVTLVLTGCDRESSYYAPEDVSYKYRMPEELKEQGCKIYTLKAKGEYDLNVVRCPTQSTISTTTLHSVGKTTEPLYTVIIDGDKYVRAPETMNDTNKHN